MYCPECGGEIPDTAKFCMECGTDLRPFQQLSGGGVNTGDVGMMKDSQMENTESQQQASIEQNPTINIQLGEIIRESVSQAIQQGTEEQQQAYERIQETSVSVTPEIADLLKKAKFAVSEDEAESYYDQILKLDIENDVAWYQKYLLKQNQVVHINMLACPNPGEKIPHFSGWQLVYECCKDLQQLKSHLDSEYRDIPESDIEARQLEIPKETSDIKLQLKKGAIMPVINRETGRAMNLPSSVCTKNSELEALRDASVFFGNTIKASPQSFRECTYCSGDGYELKIDPEAEWDPARIKLPIGLQAIQLCSLCFGMGQVRSTTQ